MIPGMIKQLNKRYEWLTLPSRLPKSPGKIRIFRAGALYYAIFISFFIALISGFMILQQWYQQYYILYVTQGERLERNLQSAGLISIQNPKLFPVNEEKTIDLFEDSLDMVTVAKRWWGGYQLIESSANWRVINKSKKVLVGIETLPKDVITLYLADDGKYLSIAGKTGIKGNCFIPKLGIRKAYIEGTGYAGSKLIDGIVKNSEETLPEPDQDFISQNKLSEQQKINQTDSIISFEELVKKGAVENSFYNKTLRLNTNAWLTLENTTLKGNIKIFSTTGITVKKTAYLQDIVLYAPKVEFEEEFQGTLQCFATDTLLIGPDCIFKFPTLLALNETTIEKPIVDVGKGTVILGDIVVVAKSESNISLPECTLQEKALVNGSVYCAGKVNLKGSIRGQLFCKGFILRTYSSIYENHLLNAELDGRSLSQYYAGAMFLTSGKLQKTIKCLD